MNQPLTDRLKQIEALALSSDSHELDLALLNELFAYKDGALIRKRTVHYNARAGDIAGTVDKSTGYVKVNFDGKVRLAHRLVWALVRGEQPPRRIDHRDTNRANNRIENLRFCTNSQNQMNRGALDGRFKGVTPRNGGKFMAQITVSGRYIYLGLHESEESAAKAYDVACTVRCGEFARPNFHRGAAL